jgi:zinc transport system substrate-binding protein
MWKVIIYLFFISCFLFSCGKEDQKPASAEKTKPKVISVNYPLHFFSKRIGGDFIDPVFPIPADEDPAYWSPDGEAIGHFQKADLILDNGADYAKWMKKVSLPLSKVVNTSRGFQDKYIKIDEGITHSHGLEGEHEHTGYAFTTWLNFKFAILQAEAVKNALQKLLPDSKTLFQSNYDQLKNELEKIDQEMVKIAGSLERQNVFASHPVYQYLAEGYELNIVSEHWEPAEMPMKPQWTSFKENLKKYPAKIMLWEDNPHSKLKTILYDMGITTVVFNPCANQPKEGDFLTVMNENVERLKDVVNNF